MSSMADHRQRRRNLQVVLAIFPGLYLIIGMVFLFQSPLRTSGPAYEPARAVPGGMGAWGVIFAFIGVAMTVAVAVGVRRWVVTWLVLGAGLVGFWAAMIFKAAVMSPLVSWTGVLWIGFVCMAHLAVAYAVSRNDSLR